MLLYQDMPAPKTSSDNLAKARQVRAERLAKQKELDKYIIYDSDGSSDDMDDDEIFPISKTKKKPAPRKPKQLRSKKSIEKADVLKKELEEIRNELRTISLIKNKPSEPIPKAEPIPKVEQDIPKEIVQAVQAVQPIQTGRNKLKF